MVHKRRNQLPGYMLSLHRTLCQMETPITPHSNLELIPSLDKAGRDQGRGYRRNGQS